MGPCFEHEVAGKAKFDEKAERTFWNGRNLTVDPMVAKAFWKEATGHFTEIRDPKTGVVTKEAKNWEGTIAAMQKKTGFQPETISRILLSDRRM